MTDPITLDLAGIRARAEAATPAHSWKKNTGSTVFAGSLHICTSLSEANAAHIAGMDPPTTLALVDEVERLTREIRCPIGLDDNHMICSAGSCLKCSIARAVWRETEDCRSRAEAAEAEAAKLRARVAELEGKISS